MSDKDLRRTAAHYRGVAAGAQRMKDMGHKTASGGGSKPPKKGCGKKTAQVVVLVASLELSALVVLVDRWI